MMTHQVNHPHLIPVSALLQALHTPPKLPTAPLQQSSTKESNNQRKMSDDKICSQALSMIKFLGTLNMKKLYLRHDP